MDNLIKAKESTLKKHEKKILISLIIICFLFLYSLFLPPFYPIARYPKYRTAEAKIFLMALYNAEVNAMATHGTYATCIEDLGLELSTPGFYIIGFKTANPSLNNIIKLNGKPCSDKSFVVPKQLKKANAAVNLSENDLAQTSISKNTFTASAVGIIGLEGDNELDIWTINEKKELLHVQNGVEKLPFYKLYFRNLLR